LPMFELNIEHQPILQVFDAFSEETKLWPYFFDHEKVPSIPCGAIQEMPRVKMSETVQQYLTKHSIQQVNNNSFMTQPNPSTMLKGSLERDVRSQGAYSQLLDDSVMSMSTNHTAAINTCKEAGISQELLEKIRFRQVTEENARRRNDDVLKREENKR